MKNPKSGAGDVFLKLLPRMHAGTGKLPGGCSKNIPNTFERGEAQNK